MKNKIKAIATATIIAVFLFVSDHEYISAADETAADKVKKAVKDAGTEGTSFIKTVGAVIAGLISVLTGLAAIVIVVRGMWDVAKQEGANDIFGKYGSTLFMLIIGATFSGLIAAAFAFA